jgi:hypothetical protein
MLKTIYFILIWVCLPSFLTSQNSRCLDYPGIPKIDEAHQVFQDDEGFLWINTDKGLFFSDGLSIEPFYFEYDSLSESISNWHLCTMQDKDGKLWFGRRGKSISVYDKKDNSFVHYTTKDGFPGTRTWQIIEYKDEVWMADEEGLIQFIPEKNEWNLFTYEGYKFPVVRSILPDQKENKFWLATYIGLMEFDLTLKKFIHHPMSNINKDPRGTDWLLIDLFKINDAIYCASWGGGLLKYNLNNKSWKEFYTDKRLNDLVLLNLDSLNENQLMATSYHTGPLIFNIKEEIFNSLQTSFKSLNYTDGFVLDHRGMLWITSNDQFCGLPFREEILSVKAPRIKKVLVDNRLIQKTGVYYNKVLNYAKSPSSIRFEFNNINNIDTQNYNFQYQLEGHDKDWIDCGKNTSTTYSSLSGGKYLFKVRSSLGNNSWLSAKPIAISIKKKFYQEWWFILGSLCAAFALFGAFYFFNLKRIKEREALKTKHNKELLEMEMMALRAQMNPHFMFNSLNSINQFIMTNEPRVASKYLSKFAQLMRSILNNSKEQEVTLEDELKMISLYMEMEALRFKQKFEQTISIDPSLNASIILIQPMIIQPYIENAIWHGIMSLDKPGKIDLNIYRKEDRLMCEIEDNGVGRVAAAIKNKKSLIKKKSMGMQITSKRMELAEAVNQIKSSLEIIDKKDEDGNAVGTKVILSLPFKTKSNS